MSRAEVQAEYRIMTTIIRETDKFSYVRDNIWHFTSIYNKETGIKIKWNDEGVQEHIVNMADYSFDKYCEDIFNKM